MGGTLNCADPSVFPEVDSMQLKLVTFRSQPKNSLHPSADYVENVAQRAGEGTCGTMQAVISLEAALRVLRVSVPKKSFVEYTNGPQKQQTRYTTFLACTFNPDRLYAEAMAKDILRLSSMVCS
jgi:hypothetical protein